MSANESFPRPWRVERNPRNGLRNIVIASNGRLVAEPLPIDGATAEDCEAVAAEIAAAAPGNVAALREALESVRNWCLNRLGNASYQVTIEGLLSIVHSALTAPARNCDRFQNFDEAIKTYAKENNVTVPWDMETYARMAMWLLATANPETKGESNG